MTTESERSVWTAIVAIVALLVVLGLVLLAVRSTITGPGTVRKVAFANIETDIRSNTLIGMTEAQVVTKFGPGARGANGRLIFATGRKVGNPLEGPRDSEELVLRLNEAGLVVEASLETTGVPR